MFPFAAVLLVAVAAAAAVADQPPKLPTQYSVEGVLRLPYVEIEEPFSAFYDAVKNKSRIDYYGGEFINLSPIGRMQACSPHTGT